MPTEIAMSEEEPTEAASDTDHLAELEDGAGCAEIWEHLSDRRETDDD